MRETVYDTCPNCGSPAQSEGQYLCGSRDNDTGGVLPTWYCERRVTNQLRSRVYALEEYIANL